MAGLVEAGRLRGRADEEAREHVRERGVVLREGDQAREQVRPAQEGALQRRGPAEREVVAAAAARHAAVDEVLLGVQARVQRGVEDRLAAAATYSRRLVGRGDVDLEHAGVGRDRHAAEDGRGRGRVALEHERRCRARCGRRRSRRRSERKSSARGERREEDEERAVATSTAERGADGRGERRDRAVGSGHGQRLLLAAWRRRPRAVRGAGRGDRRAPRRPSSGHAGAEGLEGEAQADGAVARDEEEVAPPEGPALAHPGAARAREGRTKPASRRRGRGRARGRGGGAPPESSRSALSGSTPTGRLASSSRKRHGSS